MEHFRIKLDEIANEDSRQIEFIKGLKDSFNHTIVLIEESDLSQNYYPNYNCYMHAFNLAGESKVDEVAKCFNGKIRPGNEFVKYLIKENILMELPPDKVRAEDIIIYFDGKEPRHAGKINLNRVTSKWNFGHLWEHAIYEVPLKFGSELKYFKKIEKEASFDNFLSYKKLIMSRMEEHSF